MAKKTTQRIARKIERGELPPIQETIDDVQHCLHLTVSKIVERMLGGELDTIALQTVVRMVTDLASAMERLGNAGASTMLGMAVERVVTLSIPGIEPIKTKIGDDNGEQQDT
jgi:hypothetical protein